MAEKKYVSLARLSKFLDGIKAKYSQIGHNHTILDLTDYQVDSELSSLSTNPVQNKTIDAEFESVATAMSALESVVDTKISSPEIASTGQLLSVKSVDKNGNIVCETVDPNTVGDSLNIDTTLTIEGNAADAKATGDRLYTIESQVADLMYKAINIVSFTNSVKSVERGSTVTDVELNWNINKVPSSLILDSESIDASLTKVVLSDLSIKTDKFWTLKAIDERGAISTKTTKIAFMNRIYYGAKENPEAYDSDFIMSLSNKPLSSSKISSFSVTSEKSQYVYYCLPVNMGHCSFNVGGFDGGVNLVATVALTNPFDYTEDYYVYRSDNANLGTKTFKVV